MVDSSIHQSTNPLRYVPWRTSTSYQSPRFVPEMVPEMGENQGLVNAAAMAWVKAGKSRIEDINHVAIIAAHGIERYILNLVGTSCPFAQSRS